MPVLGALFSQRSPTEERDRPRHHRHAASGASGAARRRLKTPLDDTLPPNDVDLFLMGKTEVPRHKAIASPAEERIAAAGSMPFTGHMLDLPKGGVRCGPIRNRARWPRAAAGLPALAGCSEYYFDRRDDLSLTAAMRWPAIRSRR